MVSKVLQRIRRYFVMLSKFPHFWLLNCLRNLLHWYVVLEYTLGSISYLFSFLFQKVHKVFPPLFHDFLPINYLLGIIFHFHHLPCVDVVSVPCKITYGCSLHHLIPKFLPCLQLSCWHHLFHLNSLLFIFPITVDRVSFQILLPPLFIDPDLYFKLLILSPRLFCSFSYYFGFTHTNYFLSDILYWR